MISVLVVDDSALVRRLVTGVLSGAPGIQVVGTAGNGEQALSRMEALNPDLVTLDIEMPVMDGLSAMRELRRRHPALPVIMLSTLTTHGAAATLDALEAGASDYVTKPSTSRSLDDSLATMRDQLIPRVRALAGTRLPTRQRRSVSPAAVPGIRAARPRVVGTPQIVAMGSSTGGPDALSKVLGSLTERPGVPIVAVQHMPPVFTAMLAKRLDRLGPATVVEAEDGKRLEPGVVHIAPGGRHLEVRRSGAAAFAVLHDRAPENYSRPSVDVLFRSVTAAYPGRALAVVLTGMGHDGRDGAGALAASGALVVAQDQKSSVVWGMPGAVVDAGIADAVLPIAEIGPYVSGKLRESGPAARTRIAGMVG
jgi:two-component system chemotaxis response regulator CheB